MDVNHIKRIFHSQEKMESILHNGSVYRTSYGLLRLAGEWVFKIYFAVNGLCTMAYCVVC